MATSTQAWELSGQYFETCSCDFLCPCITSNLTARPTKGECVAALVFQVENGSYGPTNLDGLSFAVVLRTPDVMIKGDWAVGLIVDERADDEQQHALAAIASGRAGGPMAHLAPLIGDFRGIEIAPINVTGDGMSWSVTIPGVLDQAVEGVPGASSDQPLYVDNTLHPANPRLALARAQRSHLHGLGFDWDDTTGQNNGHFAPFDWRG